MPFDEHNYEYVSENSFAQKRALVADNRFKIIQKRQKISRQLVKKI